MGFWREVEQVGFSVVQWVAVSVVTDLAGWRLGNQAVHVYPPVAFFGVWQGVGVNRDVAPVRVPVKGG